MYRITLILSIVSFLTGKVLSDRSNFMCQCYCSLSEYIFRDGELHLDSVKYMADIKPITLNGSGKDGLLEFSNGQPNLRSQGETIQEYRTGTLALWNSEYDLKSLSSIDKPNGDYSVLDLVRPFDEIFMDVNRISKSVISMDKNPAVLIFGGNDDRFQDKEYQQKYCEKACQRPISSLKQYSYSRTEFVELSQQGNIFNQYPSRDSDYYPNLAESIKGNTGKDKCESLVSSLTGIETSWSDVYEEIRRVKNDKILKEEFIRTYPVISRKVSEPVEVELTSPSMTDYINSTNVRIKAFEKHMSRSFKTNIVKFPDNMPSTFEQSLSPLFQFRAKLVLKDNVWEVSEMYTGTGTHFKDFSSEFLNLLFTNDEIENLLSHQKRIIEGWAAKFWNSENFETHLVPSVPLESMEQISKDERLNELEEWINLKERQTRFFNGDLSVLSLLQLSSLRGQHVHFSGKFSNQVITPDIVKNVTSIEEVQFYGEELHIVYYGLLTLNCFTQQVGNIGDNQYSSLIVFNLFPDMLFRRDSDNSFRKIQVPRNEKKWAIITDIFGNSAIDHLIKSSSYNFVLQLAKHNPQLYLSLFRDLKYVFGYNDREIFSKNTCSIPKNKHHVEVVTENEDTLQKSINRIFTSDPFGKVSETKIRFTDVNHFNLLKSTMSKCLGILPPSARVRVNEHFKNRHSVVSDYVCAIDEEKQDYLLQLYSRYNIN